MIISNRFVDLCWLQWNRGTFRIKGYFIILLSIMVIVVYINERVILLQQEQEE